MIQDESLDEVLALGSVEEEAVVPPPPAPVEEEKVEAVAEEVVEEEAVAPPPPPPELEVVKVSMGVNAVHPEGHLALILYW